MEHKAVCCSVVLVYLKHMVLIINQRAEPKSQIDGSPL